MMSWHMTGNFGKLIVYFYLHFPLLGVAIAGIILFIVNLKKIRFQPGMNTIPKGKRLSTTVLKRWNGSLYDRLDRDYHCTALFQ